MAISIFDDKQIDLDLNAPTLSFTTHPTGVGSSGVGVGSEGGGTVSLTGIASTSLFGSNTKLTTTITVEGIDSGARTTIPVEISKEVIATRGTKGETGIFLK